MAFYLDHTIQPSLIVNTSHEHVKYLEHKVLSVFSVGQCTGECFSEYVVVRDAGAEQWFQFSSYQVVYELLLYVPVRNYSSLDAFSQKVKAAMKELYPMMIPLYSEIADFVDDDIKAHMRVLQYRNNRKIDNI